MLPILALAVNSCAVEPKENEDILYQNDKFTVFKDKVVQGDNEAKVISSEEIRSNYQSPASANYSNLVSFKFTINEKDIELPSGNDHHVKIAEDEHESPVFIFGKADEQTPEDTGEKLKPNHEYTFRADMRPVLEQFEKKGLLRGL